MLTTIETAFDAGIDAALAKYAAIGFGGLKTPQTAALRTMAAKPVPKPVQYGRAGEGTKAQDLGAKMRAETSASLEEALKHGAAHARNKFAMNPMLQAGLSGAGRGALLGGIPAALYGAISPNEGESRLHSALSGGAIGAGMGALGVGASDAFDARPGGWASKMQNGAQALQHQVMQGNRRERGIDPPHPMARPYPEGLNIT